MSEVKFLRRVDPSDYLEDQTVSIGGGSDDVENLLIGSDLLGFECEIEGERVIFLGFKKKN